MKKTLLIIIAIMISGCGIRKSQSNHLTEKKKQAEISSVKNDLSETSNLNVKQNTEIDSSGVSTIEKITWSPVDPTRTAMIIEPDGTKTILDNGTKTTEKTIKKGYKNTKKAVIAESNTHTIDKGIGYSVKKTDYKIDSKEKATENKRFVFSWNVLWLLLLPAGYYLYKKYKSL